MAIKDQVLNLFETHKGIYFSGEEMAQALSVSRSAVWKAVNTLRQEGYAIDAVTNRGYCLSENSDILSPQGIGKYLQPQCSKLQLQVLPTVDSTNAVVRKAANTGAEEGIVVLANMQTAGRGRYGRAFYSPMDTGVYLSLLLRPTAYAPSQAVRMTTMAAVAMCEAIEETAGKKVGIKWVNDIYADGKKVCGILTEGSFNMESGLLDYAVLGVGVNVSWPAAGFPAELEQIAGAIFESGGKDQKNRLTAAFLNRFMFWYQNGDPDSYTEKYRTYSLVIGRQVEVFFGQEVRLARVLGIDDACQLQVRYDDGKEASLSYGEIRIKL